MSKDDSGEDRKDRIEFLKRKIEEMTGEKPVSFGSGRCSPELKEKFWEYVLAFEEGQHHTHQANKYVANHSFTVYSHMLLYQYLFYQITQKGSICITS